MFRGINPALYTWRIPELIKGIKGKKLHMFTGSTSSAIHYYLSSRGTGRGRVGNTVSN
jgi:hypothetical protein